MADEISRMAEKYVHEMKKAAGEAQKGFENATRELDRLGRMMYDDVKTELKDSGSSLNQVRDRMMDDLNREVPEMMDDMRRLEKRMEQYLQEMRDEIRKMGKQ